MIKMKYLLLLLLFWFPIVSKNSQKNEFTFQNGKQKIVLSIVSGKNYLQWEEQSVLKLACENIDPKKLSVTAPGLSLVKGADDNNESLWQLTPKRELIKSDTLKLKVWVKNTKKSSWKHTFEIVVRN